MNLSALLGRVELFAATANKLDKSQTRLTETAKTASEKPVRVTRRGCLTLLPRSQMVISVIISSYHLETGAKHI